MRRISRLQRLAIAATLCVAYASAHAVDVNGRIKGTVTDPSGAVVSGADVTATNQETGVKFTVKAQANGD